jgi:hypothetical protein
MRKQPIWIIIFTIVLDTLGIGILVPVVPQLPGNPASALSALSHRVARLRLHHAVTARRSGRRTLV